MPLISVTRLRLRSPRHLPAFGLHAIRSLRQLRAAPGFLEGALLADRRLAFWTMTAWDERGAMRASMASGAHRAAMPLMVGWCDEASVVHWDQLRAALPSWAEADRRMRLEGRPSELRHPGPRHADLSYRPPRLAVTAGVSPRGPGRRLTRRQTSI